MSVLINGMKMPKEGYSIVIDLWNNGKAYVYGTKNAEMHEAVELPDHGDLIDRDALNATDSWEWIRHDAPVVIPAERSEDGGE